MTFNIASAILCACGCGKVTPIAPETRPKRGWKKGQPMPYYPHHSKNTWPVSDGVTKRCRSCLADKSVSEFWVNRSTVDGLQAVCRECSKADNYTYRSTTKGTIRVTMARFKSSLLKFSMSQSDYDAMLAKQNYVCAICQQPERVLHKGSPRRLAVDHCHTTGRVRGLLCCHCNHAIGKLKDDPQLIRRAADYVQSFQ
jgi:hypothetical protein